MHHLFDGGSPTTENPADLGSREMKATVLKESSLWLPGPEFLSKDSEYWPVQPANVQYREELCELKSVRPAVYSLVTSCIEDEATEATVLL